VRRAFTLVELLVVIAIIGVLVALLLPAIQAAREAARRSQCKNNLKNIGLSILNYESAHKEFPTGGATYGDRLECYAENGKAWVGKKQGMSWAYQILPYLEQGALHNIGDTNLVQSSHVPLYNCPSRRGPTLHDSPAWGQSYLMDYAGAQPATLGQSNGTSMYIATRDFENCERVENAFWSPGGNGYGPPVNNGVFDGVIVRSPWRRDGAATCGPNPAPGTFLTGVPNPTRIGQITDGTSNTMMIGEKYVYQQHYDGSGGDPSDDRGWLDGWDPDTMRCTMAQPLSDSGWRKLCAADNPLSNSKKFHQTYMFGSAHSGGFNCVFADGSVHSISYDVPIDVLNSLGTKGGEAGQYEVVDFSGLN
jgi:prepilin-type N-terminal cleavage/methylation domain-containing protein/prepilin-type processing-associated H-X9-DG protein